MFFFLVLLFTLFSTPSSTAAVDQNNPKVTIMINYSNDTASSRTISVDQDKTITISQAHSWTRDSSSRYNLVSYSIDNGQPVLVNRTFDRNFTVNITTNKDHDIMFFARPQFEIVEQGPANLTFVPQSPTNDNWFDENTDVQFIASHVVSSDKQDTREQLDGWSLDNSYINEISRQESGTFKSQMIHMSSTHNVNLEYKTQYYISVISNFGRALGTGWYNSGAIVDVSVIPGDDGIVSHTFSGWQGSTIGNQKQMAVETLADSPKTLVAMWSVDYTNVSVIVIIIIAVLVLAVIYKKRKTPPSV